MVAMNMCQSWAFMVKSFFFATCFKGALQYSVGTLKDFKQSMNTISSSSFSTYGAISFNTYQEHVGFEITINEVLFPPPLSLVA
jgi:hypothetical protein